MASDNTATLSIGSLSEDILLITEKPIEHSFTKEMPIILVPKQNTDGSQGKTWIIDLKRNREDILIKGILEDTSTRSALQRKTRIIQIANTPGNITLAWGSGATAQSYIGNILKFSVSEVPGEYDSEDLPATVTKTFMIDLSFVLGDFKG